MADRRDNKPVGEENKQDFAAEPVAKKKAPFFGRDYFALRKSPAVGVTAVVLFMLGIALLPGEKLGALLLGRKGADAANLGNMLYRIVGLAAAVLLACDLGLHVFGFGGRGKGFLLSLPFIAVAVNNFPIIGVARGDVTVSASALSIILFAGNCLAVGLFEEVVFRGIVFPLLLTAFPRTRKGVFWALIVSGALFGGVHLVNLLSADPGSVIMQVGYSFLVGIMCGMVMLMCRNVFACAFLHALFNFGGLIADTEFFGTGVLWSPAEIVLTAAVALLATAYGVWLMLRSARVNDAPLMYGEKTDTNMEKIQ